MRRKRKLKSKNNNWQFISINDSLPPEGDGLVVLAIDDTAPGVCVPTGQIVNSTWFNNHHKEEKFTHWMLLPPRPMESTEKLLWSEIKKQHRVKLPEDSYSSNVFICRDCEKQSDIEGYGDLFTLEELRYCAFTCKVVGFAPSGSDVMLVTQCKKCEKRWYSHAYRKETYNSYLNGELGKF